MDFILKNSDSIFIPRVIIIYWWITLLTHPQQPGTCFIFSFSFLWALQQKLEPSNLILFDRAEGEAIITCDTNATICMMSLGPGQVWDATSTLNWRYVVVTGISESTAVIYVLIFIEVGNFI